MILDHSDDKQVNDLFEKVKKDSKGQLDILVNNAYAGVDMIFSHSKNKFYELDPVEQWDAINGVGLRNHFLCSTYASRYICTYIQLLNHSNHFKSFRMMVARSSGLIVNVSSIGGLKYWFNAGKFF